MKFCRSTLFEASCTLFYEKWKIYSSKTSMIFTAKLYFNSFRRIWRTFGRLVSRRTVGISCSLQFLVFTWGESIWFSNSKHFRFYWTKKHFISEWYFTKNHEIVSLVVRKVKNSENQQNRELGPAWESMSNCRSFHHVYRLDKSKSFKSS